MDIKVGRKAIAEATEKLKNWGRWGKDDQVGTLNHVTPQDIVKAASLIRTGKVFALGIPLDMHGPQTGLFGAADSIRSIRCSLPAPMPSPSGRTGTRSAMPTIP
jgi:hypothetical protein